jgi:hypothetical protein
MRTQARSAGVYVEGAATLSERNDAKCGRARSARLLVDGIGRFWWIFWGELGNCVGRGRVRERGESVRGSGESERGSGESEREREENAREWDESEGE